ncbi:amino acid ABC transporter permease [Labrys wisconsinensis]|uniref:His/Glu/Gln/Arg/opine family amino acid ABC transporter permease subunit n=1 Tax=Labrys wisconsinensis TaxID=425677 RepID=A0ABU0JCL5_9HYPH|nr:amino acid ABC transporter permease [Labrys wisconsinensis]MDQ0470882.1 His/Glu/Gln/Arg/opine family amino acid ABC transporter permease subunit [Labrys wisconsinensis]
MIRFFGELWENLPEWGPQMLAAAGETLKLAGASLALALLIGVAVALVRTSNAWPLRWAAIVYIEVGRGTPALVILFVIYFGLPAVAPNLQFDSFTAAVVGLGLQGGAILGEVFRAGIEAIDRGQREASLALGLTPARSMIDVIAPQALRIVLPPVGNYAIGLLKDTAIASIIAAPELMLRAKDLASSSFMPMHLYVLAALIYFAMSYPLSLLVGRLETALSKGRP